MPIPRYQPGTGNLGAAQPILDDLGGAYNKGVEAISHPIDALKGMLGMSANPAHTGADPGMVREANETFMPHPSEPVVAPPRRKPMGKM